MTAGARNGTRMTGMDQIVWNLTGDEDLFCIWGLARLAEPLRRDLVEKALALLIEAVPILNSRPVTNSLRGWWRFIPQKEVADLIRYKTVPTKEDADADLQTLFLHPIDARRDAKIRLTAIDGPDVHYLVIQVHHLVMDGEGLKRICVRFAEIYKHLVHDPDWKPVRLDPCRSWGQIARNFGLKQCWLVLKAYFINVYMMSVLLPRRPAASRLVVDASENKKNDAPSQPSPPPTTSTTSTTSTMSPPSPPYYESIVIARETMLALKAFARRRQVTVNDILMTSLSLATQAWNRERGDECLRLRFGYTANLRRWWGEPRGTFGNYSVVLMHEENTVNLSDPETALARVKRKVDVIKKRIGLDGFWILLQLKCIPYAMIRRLARKLKPKLLAALAQCHAMTNIGIIFEEAGDFGHTQAIGYSFLAPTYPGGLIVYTITTYRNVTTIHLGCGGDVLARPSARRFLNLWRQKMREVIQCRPAANRDIHITARTVKAPR